MSRFYLDKVVSKWDMEDLNSRSFSVFWGFIKFRSVWGFFFDLSFIVMLVSSFYRSVVGVIVFVGVGE